jgi:hypothetical protein
LAEAGAGISLGDGTAGGSEKADASVKASSATARAISIAQYVFIPIPPWLSRRRRARRFFRFHLPTDCRRGVQDQGEITKQAFDGRVQIELAAGKDRVPHFIANRSPHAGLLMLCHVQSPFRDERRMPTWKGKAAGVPARPAGERIREESIVSLGVVSYEMTKVGPGMLGSDCNCYRCAGQK